MRIGKQLPSNQPLASGSSWLWPCRRTGISVRLRSGTLWVRIPPGLQGPQSQSEGTGTQGHTPGAESGSETVSGPRRANHGTWCSGCIVALEASGGRFDSCRPDNRTVDQTVRTAKHVKICSACKVSKSLEMFHRQGKRHQAYCKECRKAMDRARHQANVPHRRQLSVAKIKERQKWIMQYLASHPCVDCGETDPIVLEFDHVRGVKVQEISYLIQRNGIQTLMDEVAKCDVRCANCHRRITYARAGTSYRLAGYGVVDA